MLEKKSSKYSDRPVLPMGGELGTSSRRSLPCIVHLCLISRLEKYSGPRSIRRSIQRVQEILSSADRKPTKHDAVPSCWRAWNPYLLTKCTGQACRSCRPHSQVRSFLAFSGTLIYTKPADRTAGAIILRISHGYELQGDHDPFVELADKATVQFSLSTAPGAFLVDFMPFLKYIPAWVPGAGFQRIAKEWSDTLNNMVDMPYNFTKQQMVKITTQLYLIDVDIFGI